jgi:hypothetical protein
MHLNGLDRIMTGLLLNHVSNIIERNPLITTYSIKRSHTHTDRQTDRHTEVSLLRCEVIQNYRILHRVPVFVPTKNKNVYTIAVFKQLCQTQ